MKEYNYANTVKKKEKNLYFLNCIIIYYFSFTFQATDL